MAITGDAGKTRDILARKAGLGSGMATPGAAAEVKPGGANNPTGRNQYTAPVEPVVPSDGVEVNATNVSNDKEGKGTIHGNTSDYALRRLTKAAKGQKSHGGEDGWGE